MMSDAARELRLGLRLDRSAHDREASGG